MTTEITPSEQKVELKSFLQDEIDEVEKGLQLLKEKIDQQNARGIKAWFSRLRGRIDQDDYHSLKDQSLDKRKRLAELEEGDVRLFLLRKEIGTLKENVASLGETRPWRIPTRAWVSLIVFLFFLYFALLTGIQFRNQGAINTYAMQTATAQEATAQVIAQTATAGAPTPTPSGLPATVP